MDITSANATLTLSARIAGIIGVGAATIEGFASDDAFSGEMADSAEAVMGVDGKLSFGYTPYPVKQTIALQADSASVAIFDAIVQSQNVLRRPVPLDEQLSIPSIGKTYIFTKGVLTRLTPFTPGKKILQPVQYEITWESVAAVPLAA